VVVHCGWLLKVDGTFREKIDKRQGFLAPSSAARRSAATVSSQSRRWRAASSPRTGPRARRTLHSVRAAPASVLRQSFRGRSSLRCSTCCGHAVARLQLVFAQENAIDYPESTLIALRALSSEDGPSDLLLALDMRIEHLLLDEFQDTSLAHTN